VVARFGARLCQCARKIAATITTLSCGSHLTEPGTLFSEELGLGNASRVHTREGDSRGFVVSSVQFGNGHHIANLAVLVRLGSEKWLSISHGDGFFRSFGESGEIAEVGTRVDETSSNSVRVSSDTSDDAAPRSLHLGQIINQQIDQQKMSKMIDPHALLKAVIRPSRLRISGLVHRRIADQIVQTAVALERLEIEDEIPHALKRPQLQFHHDVGPLGHAELLGDALSLLDVPHGHDDEMSPRLGEGGGAVEAEARGRSGDDGEFAVSDFDSPEDLGGFSVGFFEVEFLGEFGLGEHVAEGGGGTGGGGGASGDGVVGLEVGEAVGGVDLGGGRCKCRGGCGQGGGGEGCEEFHLEYAIVMVLGIGYFFATLWTQLLYYFFCESDADCSHTF